MKQDCNRIYTKQDIEEMEAWFKDRPLPPTMQIDTCTYTADLKTTVEILLAQAERFHTNPNLYGGIYILERIREQLQETEETKEESEGKKEE